MIYSFLLQYQIYDFAESDDSCNLKFKWYRRRTIADKMYEFCSEDEEDTENIHPLSFHFGTTNSFDILRSSNVVCKELNSSSSRKSCDIDLEDGDRVSVTSQTSDVSDFGEPHLPSVARYNIDSSNSLNRDKRCIHEENESSSTTNPSKTTYSKFIGGKLKISTSEIFSNFSLNFLKFFS